MRTEPVEFVRASRLYDAASGSRRRPRGEPIDLCERCGHREVVGQDYCERCQRWLPEDEGSR